jgi:hypothetical protein
MTQQQRFLMHVREMEGGVEYLPHHTYAENRAGRPMGFSGSGFGFSLLEFSLFSFWNLIFGCDGPFVGLLDLVGLCGVV